MSTRVTASTRVSAACRELVGQRLNIGLAADLGQLDTALDLPALAAMVSDAEISGVLATLAPAPFARAREILASAPGPNSSELVMAARVELDSAVAAASSAIAGATRDITAEAFAGAAHELRYTVSMCRGTTATGLELRRANEVVLLRIHDGGAIESDHAGLLDGSCGDRQRELEEAVARRGITLTGRKQRNHGAYHGGELISAAASRGDASLARATVTDAEQVSPPARGPRLFSADGAAQAAGRTRLRRGGAG